MNYLTSGEESIMQIVWNIGPCTIGQIMQYLKEHKKDNPLPAQTTISTFLRILVDKGFLDYKAYGKTYEYFALISKQSYSFFELKKVCKDYFGNKPGSLVSFLVEEEQLNEVELEELIQQLKSKSRKK